MGGEIDGTKVEGNMPRFKALKPDQYYVILSINKKYTFYKYINDRLAQKKGSKYVPMNKEINFDKKEIL